MNKVELNENPMAVVLLWIALLWIALMMSPRWDSTLVSLSVLCGLVSKIWSSPYNCHSYDGARRVAAVRRRTQALRSPIFFYTARALENA
ncbi:MAG: hypothetical protein CM15mP125_1350 [Gammaproteobacteria bacterium]|nr:MAG: hypothetical protein CM15mP125_1350 [Gammaproteobacteria bacterium]